MIIYSARGKDATTGPMTKPALFLLVFALVTPACNQQGGGGSVKLDNDDSKTLYTLGIMIGRNLKPFNLTAAELNIVKAGLADEALGKKPQIEFEQFVPKVNQLRVKRMGAKAEEEKKKGKAFEEKAAAEPGAERTASGMIFKSLGGGSGETPKATDTVKVNYRGTLIDGTEFDSSYKRNQPTEFPLMSVIPCWTEGVQKMKVGEKARLVCPSNIAYGDGGRPPQIPGGSTLVFEIELLGITTKAAPAMSSPMTGPPPGAHGLPPGAHPPTLQMHPRPATPGAPPATPPATKKAQ
jgi:FKBP-type peptidyl-prolyl cis-trans isomerase FkpA